MTGFVRTLGRVIGLLAKLVVAVGVGAGLIALGFLPALAATNEVVDGVQGTLSEVGRLPEIDRPAERSQLLAADGSSIGWFVGAENRVTVPLGKIPEVVREALIATEDRDFFKHGGVDRRAIARALVTNVRSGRIQEGASTITQQYIRAALLSPRVSLARKITEAIYAVHLEERASKQEILQGYLNRVYFGNGAYGVAAAAERYFGKPLGKVSLAEAAMLAGIVRDPAGNNPLNHPKAAIARRNIVLEQMVNAGFINRRRAERAKRAKWRRARAELPQKPVYPFFTAHVKEQLLRAEELGATRAERSRALYEGGLRIHTTVRPRLQKIARRVIRERLDEPREDPMGGIVSLDPRTGRIAAMAVGPKRWGHCPREPSRCRTTTVNPLVPGVGSPGRQVGSAFKPFVAATALKQGLPTSFHASTNQQAIEGCGPETDPWTPANYSGSSHGTVDMVAGTRDSINVYYAQLIAEVGPANVAETAEQLGISPEVPEYCSIALGTADVHPLDMAEAFGVFANGGRRCDPIAVTKVTDATGEVLLRNERRCPRVLTEDTAATMTALLRNVVQSGTGVAANIGRPVAGKTGTTQDYRDAWFVGFAPQLSTAVWLGYEQPRPMRGILGYGVIAGGTVPAATWSDFMAAALEGVPVVPLRESGLRRYTPRPSPKPDQSPSAADGGPPGSGPPGQQGRQVPPGQRRQALEELGVAPVPPDLDPAPAPDGGGETPAPDPGGGGDGGSGGGTGDGTGDGGGGGSDGGTDGGTGDELTPRERCEREARELGMSPLAARIRCSD